jgi:hypothetical protein
MFLPRGRERADHARQHADLLHDGIERVAPPVGPGERDVTAWCDCGGREDLHALADDALDAVGRGCDR